MKTSLIRRTVLATALLAATGLASAQAVKLTLGHGAAPGNPRHEAAVKMATDPLGQPAKDADLAELAAWTTVANVVRTWVNT